MISINLTEEQIINLHVILIVWLRKHPDNKCFSELLKEIKPLSPLNKKQLNKMVKNNLAKKNKF